MSYIIIGIYILTIIYLVSRFKGSKHVLNEAIKFQEHMKSKKINGKIVLERHAWKDTDKISDQEPTVIDLTEFIELMKVKSPLTEEGMEWMNKMRDSAERERKTFDRKILDGDIIVPKGFHSRDSLSISREWMGFMKRNQHGGGGGGTTSTVFLAKQQAVEHVIIDPEDTISKNWTEFKERNPELFHPTITHIADGMVINGTLLVESIDSKVEHTALIGNIPPNSDKPYRIYGTVPHEKIIHVIEYHSISEL